MSEYNAPIGVLTIIRVLAAVVAPLYLLFMVVVTLDAEGEEDDAADATDARHLTMSFGLTLCWIGAVITLVNYGHLVVEFWNGLPRFYHSAVFFVPGIGLTAHAFANGPVEKEEVADE